jgi:hypothetical protein
VEAQEIISRDGLYVIDPTRCFLGEGVETQAISRDGLYVTDPTRCFLGRGWKHKQLFRETACM